MVIRGIKHLEFSDVPFFSPLRRGSADPARIARIISKYALAFFNKHLRDKESPPSARSCATITSGLTAADIRTA